MQAALLGQGTFGIVVKALDHRTDPPLEVAIKLLPRGDIVSSFISFRLVYHLDVPYSTVGSTAACMSE